LSHHRAWQMSYFFSWCVHVDGVRKGPRKKTCGAFLQVSEAVCLSTLSCHAAREMSHFWSWCALIDGDRKGQKKAFAHGAPL